MKRKSIKSWIEDERPREKMMHLGAAALTNAELLAILIKSGTVEKSAVDISRDILEASGGKLANLSRAGLVPLTAFPGIGPAKAASIAACFELSRRLASEFPDDDPPVRSSDTVAKIMYPLLHDLPHEECWLLYLNRAGKLMGKERVSQGGLSSTVIDIRIIVKKVVDHLASAFILVHNHPTGNPLPGEQDIRQTDALRKAAAMFDITLYDHVIIGRHRYYSFNDECITTL